MIPANDNNPHPKFFDMLTEFGHEPQMRVAVRSLDRRFADNLWWFFRFESEMIAWEVNYNRAKIQVVE